MARRAWMENLVLSRTWHSTGANRGKFCNVETSLLIFRRRHIVLSLRHRISARNTADAETYISKKCDTQLRNLGYVRKNLLICTDFSPETEIPKDPATRYGLYGPGIESRWRTRFSAPLQTGPGYRVFPGGKEDGAWSWTPTPISAEVKERIQLYLYSPSGPSWPVLGWTLPLPLPLVVSVRSSCCREYLWSHHTLFLQIILITYVSFFFNMHMHAFYPLGVFMRFVRLSEHKMVDLPTQH